MVAVKVDIDTVLDNPIGVVKDEASREVHSTLIGDERPYATWYDWFVVGGGRFAEGDAYGDNFDNAIAYHDDPEKFIAEMDKVLGWRKDEFARLLGNLEEKSFDFLTTMRDFIDNDDSTRWGTEKWNAYLLSKMALGYWVPESHFYDISNGTASNEYILKDIEEGRGNEWVLVPVDFHH
jgi:hypothetical protein